MPEMWYTAMKASWLPRPRPLARPRTLRARVLAGVLIVTLAALAGFDLAAVSALRRYLVGQTDGQLRNVLSLYRAGPWLVPVPGAGVHINVIRPTRVGPIRATPREQITIVGPRFVLRPALLDQFNVEAVSVRGPTIHLAGNPLAGNPDLRPRLPIRLPRAAIAATLYGVNRRAQLRALIVPLRLVTRGHSSVAAAFVVTTSLAGVNRTVDRLRLILIVGSSLAGLIVALGVALVARRGLRPIETMAAQADRITAGDLTERVGPYDSHTEVGRLATALNGMLARIEADVQQREADQEATRRFFADASHELRTPLASLRANAELYQQGALASQEQVDEAMRRIALEAKRMGKLVDDMLRLARLDQHPQRERDPVDLTALITGCVESAQTASPARTWRAQISPDLMTVGDRELLRSAIDNLLANIRAHTPECAIADITAARYNGTVTIDVSDDGPGVAADQLPHLFDRFYRAPAREHRPGSGLGLAIVTAVATAHDGLAQARLNDPHGLCVTLTLPAQ
jgi:two-component system, OmpR family, sensor kinase